MSNLIPMAIAYDFDGTLSPGNMQEYDFIPRLKVASRDFWAEVDAYAREQDADQILAYMGLMLKKARQHEVPVRREDFHAFGAGIELFDGVEGWFDRINTYGAEKGVKVCHYIVSSGLREMIRGTVIATCFDAIFASGFMYDHHGIASWPALAVNYTTKTQYLFRINKGSLDVYDNSLINKRMPREDRVVPFSNMVFIGDGETDIPCMRVVTSMGGNAIAAYAPGSNGAKSRAAGLVDDGRATLIAPADYTDGSPMDRSVKAMVDKVAENGHVKAVGIKEADE
ncbi:HAD family hydrolase [Desulfoluna butyratoxydans]|uniref:Haloacid dehalogenase-like hydrolase n=1 Tax=Desulfoluna butyratoxydans TaxID=231438 RepID=A0A4U8YS46_9BACT|nr:HAD family hydrolase [Desulfoluna butyratoxydans]VFQ46730.1 haloacid dehalogenase-like hydrolase [Desulfoluna butyratoxydans]